MFGQVVPEGALFYGETRRRTVIAFDAELRALTAATAAAVGTMLAARKTPPPVYTPACRKCSLEPLCRPKSLERPPAVERWLARQLAD